VVLTAVDAAGRGGRTAVKKRLKVAAAGAGRVWASVVGSAVVEGAQGADGVFGLASWCDMAEAPAVSALGVTVGGVNPLNCAGMAKMSDRGAPHRDVPWVN